MVSKTDMIKAAAIAIVARYPTFSLAKATQIAKGAWSVAGWQGVAAIYALQTNPQRPIDIPGPVNVGWTPREQQIIDFIIPHAQTFGGRLKEEMPDFQGPHVQGVLEPIMEPIRKLKKNRFSKAVGKGVRALKASTSFGKKGTLSSPKAAFRTATKAASARRQGKKMPKSGPSRIAYKAVKGVYTDEILRRLMK